MHFFWPLSLGALVFLAVLYSLTAQLLQFRNKNSKKKKRSSWLGAVSRILQNLSLSISFLPSLPSPPFLSFSDSNLHVTNQNAIQAFHKR